MTKARDEGRTRQSNAGWRTIARYAQELRMEEAVIEACQRNLLVRTLYFDGIAGAGAGDVDKNAFKPK